MSKHTIISRRPTPFTYFQYEKINGMSRPVGSGVLINGGAGLVGGLDLLSGIAMDKRSLVIPNSVKTYVDDKALEYLNGCRKFKSDIERGLIVVVKDLLTDRECDQIAKSDMVDDEHIAGRPFTQKDLEDAGAVIGRDGGVDISDAKEDLEQSRKVNAGAPTYVRKRNLEEKRKERSEKLSRKAASHKRK